jgi:hypothetical protein
MFSLTKRTTFASYRKNEGQEISADARIGLSILLYRRQRFVSLQGRLASGETILVCMWKPPLENC